MHLIQILLPLYDNSGTAFPRRMFTEVAKRMTEEFGGVTSYRRAPAEGLWKNDGGDIARDDMVIIEVMAEPLDRGWWGAYRLSLEKEFCQDKIVLRATAVEEL